MTRLHGARRTLISVPSTGIVYGPATYWDTNKSTGPGAILLTNSNLTVASQGSYGVWIICLALDGHSSGKYYHEVVFDATSNNAWIGIGISDASYNQYAPIGSDTHGVQVKKDGDVQFNGGTIGTVSSTGTGQVGGIAVDLTAKLLWYINWSAAGTWNNASADPAAGTGGIDISGLGAATYYPGCTLGFDGAANVFKVTANFGGSAYTGTRPSGFSNWL